MMRLRRDTPGSDTKVMRISEGPSYWIADRIVETLGARFYRGHDGLGQRGDGRDWFGIEADFWVCAFLPD